MKNIYYERRSKYFVEVASLLLVYAVISDVHLYLLTDIPLIVENEDFRRVRYIVGDELESDEVVCIYMGCLKAAVVAIHA